MMQGLIIRVSKVEAYRRIIQFSPVFSRMWIEHEFRKKSRL